MGFFSSRKAEDNDQYLTTTATTAEHNDNKSVVHVIRSRFYGKNKGKEREDQPRTSFSTTHGTTVAQTLSISTPSLAKRSTTITTTPSPLSGSNRPAGPSILRPSHNSQSYERPSTNDGMGALTAPSSPRSRNQPSASPRKPTDNVTMTLAQRLNELAAANSEGLLNDDEYCLLRQNLFERFASSTVVPTETPIVPISRPRPRGNGSALESRPTSRPLSNFQVDLHRSPSISSKSSVTSGVANFLRRATSRRRPGSSRESDTSSVISSSSKVSNLFRPRLVRKQSSSSVLTTTSRAQTDAISISSRQTTDRTPSEYSPHFSLGMGRSTASFRRFGTPPSSFPTRVVGSEARYAGSDILDDDHLKTTAEIREEILAVEAEAKSLMDAFNGLELTTLARIQRHQGRVLQPPSPSQPPGETGRSQTDLLSTLGPDGRSLKRILIAESDVASIKSATSAGTAASVARTAYSGRRAVRSKGSITTSLSITRSDSVHRKNSTSSMGSQWANRAPPVPSLPSSYGHLGMAGSSNVSLTRSTGMSALVEDERSVGGSTVRVQEDEVQAENEMDDIRARREEVSTRYETRLEYLRARLKGAQLHEKLLKK